MLPRPTDDLQHHILFTSLVVASSLVSAAEVVARGPQFGNGAMNRYLNPLAPLMQPLRGGPVSYTSFKGDGTTAQGWPDRTDWADLPTMFVISAKDFAARSCLLTCR